VAGENGSICETVSSHGILGEVAGKMKLGKRRLNEKLCDALGQKGRLETSYHRAGGTWDRENLVPDGQSRACSDVRLGAKSGKERALAKPPSHSEIVTGHIDARGGVGTGGDKGRGKTSVLHSLRKDLSGGRKESRQMMAQRRRLQRFCGSRLGR